METDTDFKCIPDNMKKDELECCKVDVDKIDVDKCCKAPKLSEFVTATQPA